MGKGFELVLAARRRFLGVEQKIRYLTFDELCEERLAHIRQASKELVETGQVTAARLALEELI